MHAYFNKRNQEEKTKWLQDLYEAIEKARNVQDEKFSLNTIKSNSI
jgi:hypothetical protein